MSAEENKAIVQRFLEAGMGNPKDLGYVDEFVSPNYSSERREIHGIKEYKQRIIDNRNSFAADVEGTIDEMIAEGDKVVVRGTWSGTHKGTAFGIAPTGKRYTIGLITIYRLAGGKIVDEWAMGDFNSMFRQIGAYPSLE